MDLQQKLWGNANDYSADMETPFGYLSAIHRKSAEQSDLFIKFCDIAGLPCLVVGGQVRTNQYEPSKNLTDHRNKWNLVYCAYGWRIVDCHWGGTKSAITIPNPAWILIDGTSGSSRLKKSESVTRSGSGNSDTSYKLDEFYFLTDPDKFIYNHFVDQPKHQLLDQPKTLDQFKELALLSSGFFWTRFASEKSFQNFDQSRWRRSSATVCSTDECLRFILV